MALGKISNAFSKFFAMDPDEDEAEEEQPVAQQPVATEQTAPQPAAKNYRGNKVVAMKEPTEKTAKIVVYEPRIYSDAKEIGNHLLNNKAVVVNFDRIKTEEATRIVDFLTGTVFAINGEIKRVGEMIFLVTPANFQIDGSLAATLGVDADTDMDL
ncbi:cell division protein SepF [Lacticaseibacillus mingshuiensis]|uniref:Cell division protein SepF n=1 Tax=Lacticaseibacillus mingshuiensis TaxID=2799574 RepID=A0ABW4CJY6_9LACO|nr:cell division protein SepF [Lacticaseibacillus mingshuiensis]